MNKVFKLFLAIFILTTFNRELRVFSFDLRYVVVALALILIAGAFFSHKNGIRRCGNDPVRFSRSHFFTSDFLLLYVFVAFSNVSWIWNGLSIDIEQFVNLTILNATNFLVVLVAYLYFSSANREFVVKMVAISLMLLFFSMTWVYFGNRIPDYLMDPLVRESNAGELFVNAFGQNIRVAGFAEDANLASLFTMVGLVFSIKFIEGRFFKIVLFVASLFCFAISFSTTLFFGLFVVLACCFLRSICKKSWSTVSWICTAAIVLSVYLVIPNLDFLKDSLSMQLRLNMWQCAQDVFLSNPIFGGGLSSARAQMDTVFGSWYVQCHSTWWQMLSEHGIIATILFVYICGKRLAAAAQWVDVLLLVQLFMLFINYEIAFQQIFIFLLCMYPILFFDPNTYVSAEDENAGTVRHHEGSCASYE